MQSSRMISIQKRAKRRIVVMAIAATACAGYGALTLFGQEDGVQQLPIEKLSKAPGVKAVGIRLVNSNGQLPQAPSAFPQSSTPSSAQSSLLPPAAFPVASVPPSNIPTSLIPPATLPPATLPPGLTTPSGNMDSLLPPPNLDAKPTFTSLPVPPRMTDIQSKAPTGKVVMKLSGADAKSDPSTNRETALPTVAEARTSTTSESVDIRVIQSRSMGQPAKMAPFVLEQPSKNADFTEEKPKAPVSQPVAMASTTPTAAVPVRMSLADSTDTREVVNVATPKSRAPQLVKSKPTQLDHVVVLAQSTGVESRKFFEEPEMYVPPVEVDASLVPHSVVESNRVHTSKVAPEVKSIVTDAVADAFSSIAPPSIDLQKPDSAIAGKDTVKSAEQNVDRTRRKFDQRPAFQIPIATVDLECLAATSMDLAGNLVAIAVQDENVCKVLANERNVSLLGNQTGTTLVQIWTADLGEKPQVIRVNVSQQWGKVQAKSNEVKDIKQVIAQSFPKANVSIVSKDDGAIEVRGTTDSEESAVRILELVRKLYLVPVKDKLTVSN